MTSSPEADATNNEKAKSPASADNEIEIVENEKAAEQPKPVPLSALQLSRHNSEDDVNSVERIVVRIEVHDTGVGIRAKDLVDNKLFRSVSSLLLFPAFVL